MLSPRWVLYPALMGTEGRAARSYASSIRTMGASGLAALNDHRNHTINSHHQSSPTVVTRTTASYIGYEISATDLEHEMGYKNALAYRCHHGPRKFSEW